jgi:uncharacterized membrane protein
VNFLLNLLNIPSSEYNDWEIRLTSGLSYITWTILAAIFIGALFCFWSGLSRIQSPRKKFTIFGLRVLTFLLVIAILFQPKLELKKTRELKNNVAVLLDNSISMSIKTFPEEITRANILTKAFEKNRQFFEDLKKNFRLEVYYSSNQLESVSLNDAIRLYKPDGVGTDFKNVFTELKKRHDGRSLKGIVLFSDGGDLEEGFEEISPAMMEIVDSLEAPVYSLQTGSNESFKDLSVSRLDAPDFGFLYQPIKVEAVIDAFAVGNKNIPVTLKEGNKILVSKNLEIREGQTRYRVQLEFIPNTLGINVYKISVPLISEESIISNNNKEFRIKTIKDRMRILHLTGRPGWDSRFLREVLINNPKVDLLSFFILRSLSDDVAASTSELSLIPFPSNLLFSDYLASFDLVIFQNFKFAPFIEKNFLENIRAYVHGGGAFLMIGGELSFQGGGYEKTPVEKALPLRIHDRMELFSETEFNAKIGDQYWRHPILRLEKNEKQNRVAWNSLPKLNGLNAGLKPVPGAQVLIHDGSTKKAGSSPVFSILKFGKGKSMAMATDSSWNWNFLKIGEGGSGRYYQTFWNNVVSWVAGGPETQLLLIETDRERYSEKEKVLMKVKTLGEDFNPFKKANIEIVIRSISKKTEIFRKRLSTNENGEAEFEFLPKNSGFFSAEAIWKRESEILNSETRFGVFSDNAEFEKPKINNLLLKTFAKISGGNHRILAENSDLKDIVFSASKVHKKTGSATFGLWDNWFTFSLIVGFLALDWLLRRRSGLS